MEALRNQPPQAAARLDLVAIAADIGEQHRLAHSSATKAIEHAMQAGALLLKVKASLPHGDFLPWLAANVSFTARTAQRYMNAAAPNYRKSDRLSHSAQRRLPPPRKRLKPGSAAARRLSELKGWSHAHEVLSHASYLVGELRALERLSDDGRSTLTQLREQIDATLGRLRGHQ